MDDLNPLPALQSSYVEEYRQRYVALLDLLGFKGLVKHAEANPGDRETLVEALDLLRSTLCHHPAIDMRFTYFSDTIIVTAEHSPHGLWQLITSVCLLTRNLLQNDVLVRGAMTRGGVLHNENFVFGTAVSRAAEEEKKATFPYTVLSPEVYEDAKAYGQSFLNVLEVDSGKYFVHYLLDYAEYHSTPRLPGKVVLDDDGARVVHFISRRLQEHTGRVLEKAVWFQSYWNRTVARPDGFPAIQSGSVPACPEGPRTRIVRRLVSG